MTEGHSASRTPKIFYGWVLVGVLLLILSLGLGAAIYMYSVVAGAVNTEFAASRFMLMLGSTGMFLMIGFCSPAVGRFLDSYPSRWILLTGAMAMGLGFIMIAVSTHIWMVVASYVLFLGVGAAILSPLTVSILLSRWFVRRRGLAIGIAALGTQLGGFVYPPLAVAAMDVYGWRIAIGGLGVAVMLILPVLIWLLVADYPGDRNQVPDGEWRAPPQGDENAQAALPATVKLSFRKLLRQRNFLLAVAIISVLSAANTVLVANLSLFATDIGEIPARGALMVSFTALLGIVFSPLIGWLCDVVNIKVMGCVVILSLALACLVFSVANTFPLLLVATFFQGVGGGGVYPLWASLVGHLYHIRVYGQAMGAVTLVAALISAAAPVLGGWSHDASGSYRLMFIIMLVILLATSLLTVLIRVPHGQEEKYGATDC